MLKAGLLTALLLLFAGCHEFREKKELSDKDHLTVRADLDSDDETKNDTDKDPYEDSEPVENCDDTQNDPDNCGECGNRCIDQIPDGKESIVATCVKGECDFHCAEGYEDYDKNYFSNGCEANCSYIFEYDDYNSFKTVAGDNEESPLYLTGIDSVYDGKYLVIAYSKLVDGISNIFVKKVDMYGNGVMDEKNITKYTAGNGHAGIPQIAAYGDMYHLSYIYATDNTQSMEVMYQPLDSDFEQIEEKPAVNIPNIDNLYVAAFPIMSKNTSSPFIPLVWQQGQLEPFVSELHMVTIDAQKGVIVEDSEKIIKDPFSPYLFPVVTNNYDDVFAMYCQYQESTGGSQLVLWNGDTVKEVLEIYSKKNSFCGMTLNNNSEDSYYAYPYNLYVETDNEESDIKNVYVTYASGDHQSIFVRKFRYTGERFQSETDEKSVLALQNNRMINVSIDGNDNGLVIALQLAGGKLTQSDVVSLMGYQRFTKDLNPTTPLIYNRYYTGPFLFRSPVKTYFTQNKNIIMQYGTRIDNNLRVEITTTEQCVE